MGVSYNILAAAAELVHHVDVGNQCPLTPVPSPPLLILVPGRVQPRPGECQLFLHCRCLRMLGTERPDDVANNGA